MRSIFFLFLGILYVTPIFPGSVGERSLAVYFSPEEQLDRRIIERIDQETSSIAVAVYCLTHKGIAQALIDAAKRGVKVEVVVDRFSVQVKAPLSKMAESGISVFVWDKSVLKGGKRRPLMHNKFCIFGKKTVWTGSFNFTYDASRIHEENGVVIEDEATANLYQHRFEQVKNKGCVPLHSYLITAEHKKKKKGAKRER